MSVPEQPFGTTEILEAVARAGSVLDAGCGSGRLTLELALAGARATGIDTNGAQLEQARSRSEAAGVSLELIEADFDRPLPFPDHAFDAVTSRLSLMIAADPVATLRELRRVLAPDGRLVTALWAPPAENPWFDAPRQAVAAVLGAGRGSFARAFGRLGRPGEAADIHRAAGLRDVGAVLVGGVVVSASAEQHWQTLARDNGHFRRVEATLSGPERAVLLADLEERLARHRADGRLLIPRTLVLVTARR